MITQVIVEDENALSKETLVSTLELQRAIRTNETIAGTLRDDRPTVGIANVIARAAIRQEQPGVTDPTLDQQAAALKRLSQQTIEGIIRGVLDEDRAQSRAFDFVPDTYDPGTTEASATMVVVFQSSDAPSVTGSAPDDIIDSQLSIREHDHREPGNRHRDRLQHSRERTVIMILSVTQGREYKYM